MTWSPVKRFWKQLFPDFKLFGAPLGRGTETQHVSLLHVVLKLFFRGFSLGSMTNLLPGASFSEIQLD